jgi:hypothetical protein
MSQIVRKTSGPERADRRLGSFEVVRFPECQQGRPNQQTQLTTFEDTTVGVKFATRLKDCRTWKGQWYAESHVEEWVSRSPKKLFPGRAVHVLASQNYAHLGEKIDLLFVDDRHQFHVVELKAERVASNRGVTPDQIWGQMNRYVDFLRTELPPFLVSFRNYYGQFSRQFLGSIHDLSTDLQQIFGETFFPVADTSPTFYRTFLTEGYDDDALDFFRAREQQGDGPIRLMYYRFYFHPGSERHSVEFWEVPLS